MAVQVTRASLGDESLIAGLDLTLDQLAEGAGLDKDLLLRRMASVLSDRGEDVLSILSQE